MDLRASLKQLHKMLGMMTDDDLRALEAKLEEELGIIRTMMAVRRVIRSHTEDIETTVDLDRRLNSEVDAVAPPNREVRRMEKAKIEAEREERGEAIKAKLTHYFTTFGDTMRETVVNHMRELGFDGRAVQVHLRTSGLFEAKEGGRWGLVNQPVSEKPDEAA